MIIIEALLITELLALLLYTVISDSKSGEIKNKSLLIFLIFALPTSSLYYILNTEFLGAFLKNIAVVVVISMVLYFCDNWAAGDAKLMMTAFIAVPGRLYDNGINYFGFWAIGISFIAALFYVILDTVIKTIKNRKAYNRNSFNLLYYAKNIIFTYCLLRIVYTFIKVDVRLTIIVTFAVLLLIAKLSAKINWIAVIISLAAYTAICVYQKSFGSIAINANTLLFSVGFPVFSFVCSRFNYEEINTQNVRKGMILSNLTVIEMMKSKVSRLPKGLTEDLRSRLTEEEAESVKRWGISKSGKNTVTTVRKIPFAIFISVGYILFLAVCVLIILF